MVAEAGWEPSRYRGFHMGLCPLLAGLSTLSPPKRKSAVLRFNITALSWGDSLPRAPPVQILLEFSIVNTKIPSR